jgi:hypothetical protein
MQADLYLYSKFEDLNARHHSPLNQCLKALQTSPGSALTVQQPDTDQIRGQNEM